MGITEDYEYFDGDIVIHINTVFSQLNQMGVGPDEPFMIFDKSAMWSDFIQDKSQIQMVKTYVYLKVRIIFDPPSNTVTMEAFKELIAEHEWRLNAADDDWEDPIED